MKIATIEAIFYVHTNVNKNCFEFYNLVYMIIIYIY
jgi:hypothetical protein